MPNYVSFIPEQYVKLGHDIINAGVDIIHGHSPHHLLPIEYYNKGIIFYSLGDFIDDYAVNKNYRNDLSMIAKVIIEKSSIKIKIMPTKIVHEINDVIKPKVVKAVGNDKKFVLNKIKKEIM